MTLEEELKIVNNMCMTSRHDFGLLKEVEQKYIFNSMHQIFLNDIKPFIKKLEDKIKTFENKETND